MTLTEEINHIKDIDFLLEHVLHEARRFSTADAGSIYLAEGKKLRFCYVQNDSLFKDHREKQYLYLNQEIDINENSMAGYVALTKKPLVIDDAYRLDPRLPYQLNRSFDQAYAYRTCSVLTIPLITSHEKLIGVMQILNATGKEGQVVPFSEEQKILVAHFANQAAIAIEKAKMTREIILRMIRMAELRDPNETGAHVNRVGAFAVEIYQRWAQNSGVETTESKRVKDVLRIAAMLHDVGKVAISDTLLHKSGRLNEAEYAQIKWHTVYGARLFTDSTSDWDDLAREIALNHHEKWDGSGYPGKIADLQCESFEFGEGKRGQEIPFLARIVTLADVYDSLTSPRSYKESWPEERALEYIREQKGKLFDPELTEVFFSVQDIVRIIRQKFSNPALA